MAAAVMPADQRAEVSRHAMWPLTPKNVRAAILMMAGFPRERAGEGLEAFTPNERRRIWMAATQLASDANVIAATADPVLLAAVH